MKKDHRSDYISYRILKSRESLEAGKILADHKQWNASINRLYYACFYMVSALLYSKDINAKTHNGIRIQFGIHFIQSNLLPTEYGELYANLLDWRNKGDYSDFFDFDEDLVNTTIPEVEEFVSTLKTLF